MTESSLSLRALFDSARSRERATTEPSNEDSSTSQSLVARAIAAFENCHQLIGQLSLFSSNEDVDDIATADIQYVSSSRLLSQANDCLDTCLSTITLQSYCSDLMAPIGGQPFDALWTLSKASSNDSTIIRFWILITRSFMSNT